MADDKNEFAEQAGEALSEMIPLFNRFITWSYGTGNPGVRDGELFGPHAAEENPFDPDEILVTETCGCAILLINRRTGRVRVLYGERNIRGGGEHLDHPVTARFMPAGPYAGHVLISEYQGPETRTGSMGEHRVMIVDRDNGSILWCYTELHRAAEAIYWDDEHIMVSDQETGVLKIRLADREQVWQYNPEPKRFPFRLQRITPIERPGKCYGRSYGGDLLAAYVGKPAVVREINTAEKSTIWEYGGNGEYGCGDLYDTLAIPVCALRYGMQEVGAGLTIICDERARILCVNSHKELIWEIGGATANGLPATPYAMLPTCISTTRKGTLLITDWGLNMVYEANPSCIPQRIQKDACLFRDHSTTDNFIDSAIVESRGYARKNIQVHNKSETGALQWRALASHNAEDWQVIHTSPGELRPGESGYHVVSIPWNFVKTQARSAGRGNPAKVDIHITMCR